MDLYLINYHEDDLINIINDTDDLIHSSINIRYFLLFIKTSYFKKKLFYSLIHLQETNSTLFDKLMKNIYSETKEWEKCLPTLQKEIVQKNSMFLEPGYQLKENIHVRFVNLPVQNTKKKFPSIESLRKFVQIKGNVIRRTPARTLEYSKEYICSKCKIEILVEGKYERFYAIDSPKNCTNLSTGCKGTPQPKQTSPNPEFCMDYQEIRVQEQFSDKVISSTMLVVLENDLVDCCVPGDCITVCGTIERRSPPIIVGKKGPVLTLTLRATSIVKEESKSNIGKNLPEQMIFVQAHWEEISSKFGELNARDLIIKSIAPEIYGMYYVKLAIALSLSSCIERLGTESRENSHLFLVGDPGLAKSKLLKAAEEIAIRSVHTTGMGCSKAGLTAAVIKDDGEWQLEAGALVLADGGICCLDEFGLMRESDKSSIHEAMEQQTISIAKAGVVCRLSTRCVVIAATNPKPIFRMSEPEGTCSANIGVGSPLLSRFDLVLILKDEQSMEWDMKISSFFLKRKALGKDVWDLDKLQAHFLAVKEIRPEIKNEANVILAAYYRACRADPLRDISRTSARLLDSLIRLAQSHARLVFRNIVSIEDAVLIVQLMESSFGFGRILKPFDLIKTECPLGPSSDDIRHVLEVLKINDLNLKKEVSLEQEKCEKPDETESQFEKLHEDYIINQYEDSDDLDDILDFDFGNCGESSKNTIIIDSKRKTMEESQLPLTFNKLDKKFKFSVKNKVSKETVTQSISGLSLPRTFSQIIRSEINDTQTQELCLTGNTPEININDIFESSSSEEEMADRFVVNAEVLRANDSDVEMKEQSIVESAKVNVVEEQKNCKISDKTLAKLNAFRNVLNEERAEEPIVGSLTIDDSQVCLYLLQKI